MYISGLVDTLVTHANMKGFGLTPLFGDGHGYMPPQLQTKNKYFFLFQLKDPSRWQPDIFNVRAGVYAVQQFVTPQNGLVRPYTFKV